MEKDRDSDNLEPSSTAHEDLKQTLTVDTIHNDEAVKVLAAYHGDTSWEPAEEKQLVRKIDKRLMTILCITYGLQYYDKAMLAQAVGSSFRCASFPPSVVREFVLPDFPNWQKI
jgi:hypothetical protein